MNLLEILAPPRSSRARGSRRTRLHLMKLAFPIFAVGVACTAQKGPSDFQGLDPTELGPDQEVTTLQGPRSSSTPALVAPSADEASERTLGEELEGMRRRYVVERELRRAIEGDLRRAGHSPEPLETGTTKSEESCNGAIAKELASLRTRLIRERAARVDAESAGALKDAEIAKLETRIEELGRDLKRASQGSRRLEVELQEARREGAEGGKSSSPKIEAAETDSPPEPHPTSGPADTEAAESTSGAERFSVAAPRLEGPTEALEARPSLPVPDGPAKEPSEAEAKDCGSDARVIPAPSDPEELAKLLALSQERSARSSSVSTVLGPGDSLGLVVPNAEELTRTFTISSSGRLPLPLIGQVDAAGLTIADLGRDLRKRLEAYLQDPKVSIRRVGRAAGDITVAGAVAHPGAQALGDVPTTLSGAIERAGEPKDECGVGIVFFTPASEVAHSAKAEPAFGERSIEVSLREIRQSELGLDVILAPGDVIELLPATTYSVTGAVDQPGNYSLGRKTTLLSALRVSRAADAEKVEIVHAPSGEAHVDPPQKLELTPENTHIALHAGDEIRVKRRSLLRRWFGPR